MECSFCNVVEDEPGSVVAHFKHAAVVLSNPRLVKGHTLVIPTRHVEYPGDLTLSELAEVFELIEHTRAKLLESKLGAGVDIRQNYRPFLPESRLKKDHVHFHVIPRANEDELYTKSMHTESELFADLPDDEQQEVLNLLR